MRPSREAQLRDSQSNKVDSHAAKVRKRRDGAAKMWEKWEYLPGKDHTAVKSKPHTAECNSTSEPPGISMVGR